MATIPIITVHIDVISNQEREAFVALIAVVVADAPSTCAVIE